MEQPSARIDDPTMKVKAPDALLSTLGRSYVNAMLNTARLREVCVLLGVDAGPVLGSAQPATVVMFARAVDEWLMEHDRLLRLILDSVGSIKIGADGEVLCVGPCGSCPACETMQRTLPVDGTGAEFVDHVCAPRMMGPETVLHEVE